MWKLFYVLSFCFAFCLLNYLALKATFWLILVCLHSFFFPLNATPSSKKKKPNGWDVTYDNESEQIRYPR